VYAIRNDREIVSQGLIVSARDNQKLEAPAASGGFIWPRPAAGLRALTQEELDRLEAALEKPIDREHLKHWVSTSISNTIKFSSLPSPGQARDKLKKLASEGRRWIDQVDSNPIKGLLEQEILHEHNNLQGALLGHKTKIADLKVKMTQVCELADSTAVEVGRLIKRGGQRSTPPALIAFIDNMIGIAKLNKIPPSTPQRAMYSEKPPAFFAFVKNALKIAKDVIESSRIPSEQEQRAQAGTR
jgi:hypothetical protein